MMRFMSSVAARFHAFTPTELDAAEAKLPAGWGLDRSACLCTPAPDGQGWEATLSLVGPERRWMKCTSMLHSSAGEARAEALASVADAVKMITMSARHADRGRQTSLVVAPPQKLTLRPSQILSLRQAATRDERRP